MRRTYVRVCKGWWFHDSQDNKHHYATLNVSTLHCCQPQLRAFNCCSVHALSSAYSWWMRGPWGGRLLEEECSSGHEDKETYEKSFRNPIAMVTWACQSILHLCTKYKVQLNQHFIWLCTISCVIWHCMAASLQGSEVEVRHSMAVSLSPSPLVTCH